MGKLNTGKSMINPNGDTTTYMWMVISRTHGWLNQDLWVRVTLDVLC